MLCVLNVRHKYNPKFSIIFIVINVLFVWWLGSSFVNEEITDMVFQSDRLFDYLPYIANICVRTFHFNHTSLICTLCLKTMWSEWKNLLKVGILSSLLYTLDNVTSLVHCSLHNFFFLLYLPVVSHQLCFMCALCMML